MLTSVPANLGAISLENQRGSCTDAVHTTIGTSTETGRSSSVSFIAELLEFLGGVGVEPGTGGVVRIGQFLSDLGLLLGQGLGDEGVESVGEFGAEQGRECVGEAGRERGPAERLGEPGPDRPRLGV